MSKSMNEGLLEKFNKVEQIHWWWEGRKEILKQFIGKSRPKKILDVGCGTGETLSFLQDTYPNTQLFGIDSSNKAISFSKKRGHKNIFKASALNLPFDDNYFDIVLFLDVLEHIGNDAKAISEAKRVLKKNGRIICTNPALKFIWSEHDSNQGHKRRYSKKDVVNLAKNSNLKVEKTAYFNFLLSPAIILIRLLSRVRFFKHFTSYDNSLNYDIANMGVINSILKFLFTKEIQALKYIRYPFGISISAVFRKA
jgi:ubiquinone/menaquinone biosynthesis C-methylase UbiE